MKQHFAILVAVTFATALFAAERPVFNVVDFGAKGDGVTKNTAAFQKALDACVRARGGTVQVPEGVYLTGSLVIGPNTTLQMATKAYLLSFTEALHEELKADGVRVCALCPGPVNTGFFARAGMARDYFPAFLRQSANQVARAGYEGFMGGHRVVVPGRPNRILTLLPRLVPRWLVLAFMARRWRLTAGG